MSKKRLIDANALISDSRICGNCKDYEICDGNIAFCPSAFARRAINDTPTVDVEPIRHGRWIECDYKRLEHGMIETYPNAGYACSVCRTGFEKKKMTYKQYCAACGAKMLGIVLLDNTAVQSSLKENDMDGGDTD